MASAQTDVQFRIAPVVDVPVAIGGEAKVVFSHHVTIGGRIGFIPEAFVDLASSAAQDFGWINASEADLTRELVPGSTYLEVFGGIDQIASLPLSFHVGYAHVENEVTTSARTLLQTVLDVSLPNTDRTWRLQGDLQAIVVRVGYFWNLAERWRLEAQLGVLKPIGGTTSIELPNAGPLLRAVANRQLDEYMDGIYDQLWIPSVAVSLGYTL